MRIRRRRKRGAAFAVSARQTAEGCRSLEIAEHDQGHEQQRQAATWPSSAPARPLSNCPPTPRPAPSAPPARAVPADGTSSAAGVISTVKMSEMTAALFSVARQRPGGPGPCWTRAARPRNTAMTAASAVIAAPCAPSPVPPRAWPKILLTRDQEGDHAGAHHERQRQHTAPSRSMSGASGRSLT